MCSVYTRASLHSALTAMQLLLLLPLLLLLLYSAAAAGIAAAAAAVGYSYITLRETVGILSCRLHAALSVCAVHCCVPAIDSVVCMRYSAHSRDCCCSSYAHCIELACSRAATLWSQCILPSVQQLVQVMLPLLCCCSCCCCCHCSCCYCSCCHCCCYYCCCCRCRCYGGSCMQPLLQPSPPLRMRWSKKESSVDRFHDTMQQCPGGGPSGCTRIL
jgi:hypothetical protein